MNSELLIVNSELSIFNFQVSTQKIVNCPLSIVNCFAWNVSGKHAWIFPDNVVHTSFDIRSASYVYTLCIGNAACNVIVGNLLDVGGMVAPAAFVADRLNHYRLYALLVEINRYRIVCRLTRQMVRLGVEIVGLVICASAVKAEDKHSLTTLLAVDVGNTARKIVDDALWLAVDT